MKFLCLHGNGTNSNVMDIQTAPLRHELEGGHEFEFVEASLEAPMSQVHGVEVLSSPNQSFYTFYNPEDLTTFHTAIKQLDEFIAMEGPYDGIMAFSAGAVLAASYMLEKQRQGQIVPFDCAIFLSSANSTVEKCYLGLDTYHDVIRIPTVHIWGSNDAIAPTGGKDLSLLCQVEHSLTFVHDGGHEIPRKGSLTEIAKLIRRTIHAAGHVGRRRITDVQ
ncbi:serine hydrolase FSH [Xylaria grammica]|nr:serine hydrolase FSH [Xylaria grammica]